MSNNDNDGLPPHVDPNQFDWILSESKMLYRPTRTLIDYSSVSRRLGKENTVMIERRRVCSNLFWAPGLPIVIRDKAVIDGALIDCRGNNLFNMYAEPCELPGDPALAKFWIDLGVFLWGEEDANDVMDFLAFKVQHPDIKINHALVLGSYDQGIGKDSWLYPVRTAVGQWNWGNVTAGLAREWDSRGFNVPILRKVITQISEVHDLGNERFAWYEKTKDWCAAPPDTLKVADKNVKAHEIANVVAPIYTTNHKTDGLYIPENDRRHFVAWSQRTRSDFESGGQMENYFGEVDFGLSYWKSYWDRVRDRKHDLHIAAYLRTRNVSAFDPGRTPRHTEAWHEIVAANKQPGDDDLADVLDSMADDFGQRPAALTTAMIIQAARRRGFDDVAELFSNTKNARTWPHRLNDLRYSAISNPYAESGRWRFPNGYKQTVYARNDIPPARRLAAARELVESAPANSNNEAQEDFAS